MPTLPVPDVTDSLNYMEGFVRECMRLNLSEESTANFYKAARLSNQSDSFAKGFTSELLKLADENPTPAQYAEDDEPSDQEVIKRRQHLKLLGGGAMGALGGAALSDPGHRGAGALIGGGLGVGGAALNNLFTKLIGTTPDHKAITHFNNPDELSAHKHQNKIMRIMAALGGGIGGGALGVSHAGASGGDALQEGAIGGLAGGAAGYLGGAAASGVNNYMRRAPFGAAIKTADIGALISKGLGWGATGIGKVLSRFGKSAPYSKIAPFAATGPATQNWMGRLGDRMVNNPIGYGKGIVGAAAGGYVGDKALTGKFPNPFKTDREIYEHPIDEKGLWDFYGQPGAAKSGPSNAHDPYSIVDAVSSGGEINPTAPAGGAAAASPHIGDAYQKVVAGLAKAKQTKDYGTQAAFMQEKDRLEGHMSRIQHIQNYADKKLPELSSQAEQMVKQYGDNRQYEYEHPVLSRLKSMLPWGNPSSSDISEISSRIKTLNSNSQHAREQLGSAAQPFPRPAPLMRSNPQTDIQAQAAHINGN